MPETIGIGIIGLGVQGRRMLSRIAEHERIRALAAWDPNVRAIDAVPAAHPRMALPEGPDELLATPGLECVYIASPPSSHLDYANRAFDAGLAVFCEKPLSVDFDAARRTIARIDEEDQRAAVNFSLASSAGLADLEHALRSGSLGTLRRAEVEVAFRQWPRAWQSEAGPWLSERREGGFTREVLSHFVFVLQRILGPAHVESSRVEYAAGGDAAEHSLSARLRAGDTPIDISGRIGGEDPDFNRIAFIGDRGTIELRKWLSVRENPGGPLEAPSGSKSDRPAHLRQLDQLAEFVEGRAHTLPGFAEALAVQDTIEAMLKTSSAAAAARG